MPGFCIYKLASFFCLFFLLCSFAGCFTRLLYGASFTFLLFCPCCSTRVYQNTYAHLTPIYLDFLVQPPYVVHLSLMLCEHVGWTPAPNDDNVILVGSPGLSQAGGLARNSNDDHGNVDWRAEHAWGSGVDARQPKSLGIRGDETPSGRQHKGTRISEYAKRSPLNCVHIYVMRFGWLFSL